MIVVHTLKITVNKKEPDEIFFMNEMKKEYPDLEQIYEDDKKHNHSDGTYL